MNGSHYYFYPSYSLQHSADPSLGFRAILGTIATELVTADCNNQLGCLSLPTSERKKKIHKTVRNVVKLPGFESWHLVLQSRAWPLSNCMNFEMQKG